MEVQRDTVTGVNTPVVTMSLSRKPEITEPSTKFVRYTHLHVPYDESQRPPHICYCWRTYAHLLTDPSSRKTDRISRAREKGFSWTGTPYRFRTHTGQFLITFFRQRPAVLSCYHSVLRRVVIKIVIACTMSIFCISSRRSCYTHP